MTLITSFFGMLFNAGIVFVIFLVISKIFKSDAKGSSIFSAALSYSIIINAFSYYHYYPIIIWIKYS